MKIAVLSDIHGNYIALQTCIDYALKQGIDTFIFLGDYLGELAYPQRTMELIYQMQEKYDCFFIRGNKEDYWLGYRKKGAKGWKDKDSTTGSLLYTYSQLTERDFAFYETLPIMQEICFDNLPPFTICHGSPRKTNEKMLPGDEKTLEIMEEHPHDLIVCGHIHVQGKIEQGEKKVLNPGAIGVSLHADGKAQFMILHGRKEGWQEEFISLSYDVETIIAQLYEAGLHEKAPCWCKVTEQLLRVGDIPHSNVLARAMQLCQEETGSCVWPNVPEVYWEQAVKEIFTETH